MRKIWYIFAFLASFNLILDILVFFDAVITGEKLHPQLIQHWPINIGLVILFWYLVIQEKNSRK